MSTRYDDPDGYNTGSVPATNKTIQRPEGVYTINSAGQIVAFQPWPNARDSGSSGSGSSGMTAAQAATAARQAEAFNEEQRQFDLTQGERKARGDQEMRLAQDKFAFDKVRSDRDYDLAQRQLQASLRGPDNYIKYWEDSRRSPQGQAPTWASQAAAPAAAAPAWTQPTWQQNTQTAPRVSDLTPGTAPNTFAGLNGVDIDYSGSEWMKKNPPAWAK